MLTDAPIPELQRPEFGIVIPVYNDWVPLEACLASIDRQSIDRQSIDQQSDPRRENLPSFEVVVVDDGSDMPAPDTIRHKARSYALTVVRQEHAGIAAARNRGIEISIGRVLLFTDADCRLDPTCLARLADTITNHPQQKCFQLRLVGDCSNLVGRAEELRLVQLQEHTVEPSGCIRYLNTAGFALRRERLPKGVELFDRSVLRAEDTLLLACLIKDGELPFFVPEAAVQHAVSLSLSRCLTKAVCSAWLEGKAFELIAAKGVQIRMGYADRLAMLRSSWKAAGGNSIGRGAWFVLVTRQLIERSVTVVYNSLRIGRRKTFYI